MSLSRTALRLVTVEALRPTGLASSAEWPTIARNRVFESRLDMLDDLAAGERAPVVVVYTDNDSSSPAQASGGLPFDRIVDLVFELSIVAFAEDEAHPGTFEPAIPVTDPEAEAALDLLEGSIRFALLLSASGKLFRKLTGSKVRSIESAPLRSSEEEIRIATRTMTWRVQIPDDCFDLSPTALAAGTDRLPEPLRSVLDELPAGSYGAAIGKGLGPFAPVAPVRTPLNTVALAHDVANPDGEVDGTTDVSVVATIPQDP